MNSTIQEQELTEGGQMKDYKLPEGKVLVLRVSRADGSSYSEHANGFRWPLEVGAFISAPDFEATDKCGHGLHGWLWARGSVESAGAEWAFQQDAKAMWYVLEVDASSVIAGSGELINKCKFRSATVLMVNADPSKCVAEIARVAPAGEAMIAAVISAGDGGTASAGYRGTASAGYRGTASAGDRGTASAGDGGTASAGYRGTASAGYGGTASAGYGGTASAGYGGTASAGDGGTASAGDRGTASAGYGGTASAGDRGTASAGDRGTASAGDGGTASAGDGGTASAGYGGTASAGDGGTASAGDRGTASAGDGGSILLKRWDSVLKRYRWVLGEVGIDGIEANMPYVLDANGKMVRK